MRKALKQIAVLALALFAFCILGRLTFFRTYTAQIPIRQETGAAARKRDDWPRALMGAPAVARPGDLSVHDDHVSLPILPAGAGVTDLEILDPDGKKIASSRFRITRAGTVIDLDSGGFTGDSSVLVAVTLFWFAVSAIMVWHYLQAKGPAYYAYSTVYYAGFSLFALSTAVTMLRVTVAHLAQPDDYGMFYAYRVINGASREFMTLTMPVIMIFAAAMAVSNIALLRHERHHLRNLLGLMVSALLMAGEALGFWLFSREFPGPEQSLRMQSTFENVYATAFAYFECMLAGSVICGVTAARREPAPDKDFIVILGCWFRPDGSLPPLLRGRVDRAVAFWEKQKAACGKEAFLIPSGGQGEDEPMPEAEAMRRYLISRNVPPGLIRPETESVTTYQNMACSRKIIEEIDPAGKTVFATTNYHVFRSGVWAAQAGLPAEGIGGKTKWWFWPNAFMRECAGLLQKRWKQELLLLALLLGFFSALSAVLG